MSSRVKEIGIRANNTKRQREKRKRRKTEALPGGEEPSREERRTKRKKAGRRGSRLRLAGGTGHIAGNLHCSGQAASP